MVTAFEDLVLVHMIGNTLETMDINGSKLVD